MWSSLLPRRARGRAIKENGYAVLTEAVLQKAISRDYEIRKKLAEPRYYKDVRGNFKDLLRDLYADPFDGRLVATDKSLPDQDQKELWDIWKAYEGPTRGLRGLYAPVRNAQGRPRLPRTCAQGYFYLKDQYNKLSLKRNGTPIPIDEKSVGR